MSKKPNTTNQIFWESDKDNEISYLTYVNRICELGSTVFEWKNLPDTIDPRFLEMTLLLKGSCLFFNDEVLGYLALPCMLGGRFDVYNIPIERTAYAANGYQNKKTSKDSVIIFNNQLHTNEMPAIINYAKRLYKIDRIIDINVNAQKTPITLVGSQDERLTLKQEYQKYDGNAPFMFVSKPLNDQIIALNTGAPYVAGNLYELRTNIWNECLTFLGIPNLTLVKKERMIKDEVNRTNGGTVSSSFGRLQARKDACKKINAMFPDLNISVDLRQMDTPPVDNDGNKDNNEDSDERAGDDNV